ncbi:MAG: TlpA family protein disulfide reductase [Isosphaeraceae bacterium]
MDGPMNEPIPPVAGMKCATGQSESITLQIGDKAPALAVSAWLKGEPVHQLVEGKAYVVEFWASWCGPCASVMPHVSELQAAYPDITFISVAVWEENSEAPTEFVRQLQPPLKHRLAIDQPVPGSDDNSGIMAREWLRAAGEGGIPTAFLVNTQGVIVWIGHPAELDVILDQYQNHSLVVDLDKRKRSQSLQRMELDPTANLEPGIFAPLFDLRPPIIQTTQIQWLIPQPKTENKSVEKPATGFLGKLLGKNREEPKVDKPKTSNIFGKPRIGRSIGLLILPMLKDDGVSPGWEMLDLPALNTLPQEFDAIEFVAVLRGYSSLSEIYGEDYEKEMAAWSAELGWRIAMDVTPFDETTGFPAKDGYSEFWLENFHCAEPPLAVLLNERGGVCWVGSPIRLKEAVARMASGELNREWAVGDLLFWYKLNASASANERMAGAHQQRIFEGLASDGPKLDSDPAMLEVWEKTIASLQEQLPWRADRWRIFEFRIAAARTKLAGNPREATNQLIDRFQSMTSALAEQAETSPAFMADWKMLIQIAMEQMGLMADPLAPLPAPDLLAFEAHPFTGAILDSAARHDAIIPPAEETFIFQPRLLPILYFKMGRFDEALVEQDKMITDFDAFVAHQIKIMSESTGDESDEPADPELTPGSMANGLLTMMLGEPPDAYRANLVKLRDYYAKAAAES